jgi:hypothetical protein
MRLALRTEPKLGSNLEVKVVVDVACGDDVGVQVFSSPCNNRAANVVIQASV